MPQVAQTPIERAGRYWLKRDDLYTVAGVSGGKARSCWALAQEATGLVTAGSRSSPQVNIVAHIARQLRIPCHVHVPTGALGPEVEGAKAAGAVVIQHRPGHNSVIVARARQDAQEMGWVDIPFGMECRTAVEQTAAQVQDLPDQVERLVVPVGSGMSLAGILHGLRLGARRLPVLGVQVGANPANRLQKWGPLFWSQDCTLVKSGVPYQRPVQMAIGDVVLDPIYEAKCVRFMVPGDLLWIVGVRQETDL